MLSKTELKYLKARRERKTKQFFKNKKSKSPRKYEWKLKNNIIKKYNKMLEEIKIIENSRLHK